MTRPTWLLSAFVIAAIATAAMASTVEAADPKLRLCTARKDGVYHFAGERIAAAAAGHGVAIDVVETAGSLFNMAALRARLCDAAIAQADAVLRFAQLYRGDGIALTEPLPLHREFVHLVCRRAAGIATIGELAGRGGAARLLTGEPGSGSTVTWTVLSAMDPLYGGVTVSRVGRSLAVATLADGKADCLLHVAGLGSGYMAEVDGANADLRLVSIDSGSPLDADVLGLAVYARDQIPAGIYAGLQPDPTPTPTPTISIQALLITTSRWAERHPQGYAALRAAVEQVRPEILDLPGQADNTESDSPSAE